MTVLLAIDPATTLGFACGAIGAGPEYGTVKFADKRGAGAILSRARFWLNDRITVWKPEVVIFEAPYIPMPRTKFVRAGTEPPPTRGIPMDPMVLRRLCALVGLIEEICFERAIECRECVSVEFVKFFTGKGSWKGRDAKKEAVMRVCRIYGWNPADDNAGDALALWSYAEFIRAPQVAAQRGSTKARPGELSLHLSA